MKKICLTTLLIAGTQLISLAQDVKFFVNKSTAISSNCDCKTLSSIKAVFPIPSNVASFDSYQLYIELNSLDVPATIGFNKSEIASKLAGKKEFTAFVIKEDGTSDFYFEDDYLDKKDLCGNPRMWGMTELSITGSGVGFHITGYHTESVWNDYYSRWDTKKIEDWDEGSLHGEGEIKLSQQPLSEGFTDEYEIITVKAQETDSASFSTSEDIDQKGNLMIEDKSGELTTRIYFATWAGGDATYKETKDAVISSLSGKFQVGPVHNFYQLEGMQSGKVIALNPNSNGFTNITYNGTTYETISHYRTNPGFYATFYITRSGDYTTLILSITKEEFQGDPMRSSSYQLNKAIAPEMISTINKLNEKWLNATTFAFPN